MKFVVLHRLPIHRYGVRPASIAPFRALSPEGCVDTLCSYSRYSSFLFIAVVQSEDDLRSVAEECSDTAKADHYWHCHTRAGPMHTCDFSEQLVSRK